MSTSWRWYSCPFIVIILVNAAVRRQEDESQSIRNEIVKHFKGKVHPKNKESSGYLVTSVPMETQGEASQRTKHFWSFKAKQCCSDRLQNEEDLF